MAHCAYKKLQVFLFQWKTILFPHPRPESLTMLPVCSPWKKVITFLIFVMTMDNRNVRCRSQSSPIVTNDQRSYGNKLLQTINLAQWWSITYFRRIKSPFSIQMRRRIMMLALKRWLEVSRGAGCLTQGLAHKSQRATSFRRLPHAARRPRQSTSKVFMCRVPRTQIARCCSYRLASCDTMRHVVTDGVVGSNGVMTTWHSGTEMRQPTSHIIEEISTLTIERNSKLAHWRTKKPFSSLFSLFLRLFPHEAHRWRSHPNTYLFHPVILSLLYRSSSKSRGLRQSLTTPMLLDELDE